MKCLSSYNIERVAAGVAPVNTAPLGMNASQTEATEKAESELVSGLIDFAVGLWDGLTG
jgi:hypothetical protein